jgi:hypothetical protein
MVKLRDQILDNAELLLTDEEKYKSVLGPNLVVKDSRITLQLPAKSLILGDVKFIDCDITTKRELRDFRWHSAFLQGCRFHGRFLGNCFGQRLDGGKPIESFKEKDQLFARNESDPKGPPILGTVEKVFARMALILEMRLEGQVIGTTAEHLFWVREKKAWTAAGDIQPGDQLLSHDGRWVAVEALVNTGRIETVYNLRIAECHTYFVGGLSWGFAVWAHNAYDFTPDQNGPGEWKEVNRSQAGLETQSAFSGQPINYDPTTGQASIKEYRLGGVDFDGYSNGTLGEVKGDYSIVLEEWYIQAKGGHSGGRAY